MWMKKEYVSVKKQGIFREGHVLETFANYVGICMYINYSRTPIRIILLISSSDVFRTQSNIYDEVFWGKIVNGF